MTMNRDIAEVIRKLDAIGFDVGTYHISLYRALIMLLVAVLILIVGHVINAMVRRTFRRMHRLDEGQQLLGEKLSSIFVWVLLISWALDFLGISLAALTIFSGAAGLAIGFGLQKTFGNLISGIILLMDRSIKPGDVIAVSDAKNNTVGQVSRIGIRAVSVITRDKVEYLIPNEHLMTSTVENWSYSSRDVRIKIPISVAYDSDLDLVERLLIDEARKLDRVVSTREPGVWLLGFGDSAIQFEVQLWIDDPEQGLGNLRSDFLKAVWRSFQANGVVIPFPQREIRMLGTSAPPAAAPPKEPDGKSSA